MSPSRPTSFAGPPPPTTAVREDAGEAGGDFDGTLARSIDLRIPGLLLRGFALHRPAASRAVIVAPPPNWSKAVLFLEGAGGAGVPPEAGTVLILSPGGTPFAEPPEGRLPVCVVFEFRLADRTPRRTTACALPRAELLQAREQLAWWLRLQAAGGAPRRWESAVVILNLLMTVLRAAGWLGHTAAPAPGDSAMHRLLLTMPLESPLRQVVQRSGYQRDHLNRLVKKETGLTLGQFRAQRRLTRAKELLARGVKVGDVAGEIGLPDQSYFARWFRRQTGRSPSQWLHHGVEPVLPALALCG